MAVSYSTPARNLSKIQLLVQIPTIEDFEHVFDDYSPSFLSSELASTMYQDLPLSTLTINPPVDASRERTMFNTSSDWSVSKDTSIYDTWKSRGAPISKISHSTDVTLSDSMLHSSDNDSVKLRNTHIAISSNTSLPRVVSQTNSPIIILSDSSPFCCLSRVLTYPLEFIRCSSLSKKNAIPLISDNPKYILTVDRPFFQTANLK